MEIDLKKLGLDFSDEKKPENPKALEKEEADKIHGNQHDLATLVAYIIGVTRDQFGEGHLFNDTFEEMDRQDNLKIIRCLSILRTNILRGSAQISRMKKMTNASLRASGMVDTEAYDYLSGKNIRINAEKTNSAYGFLIPVNRYIKERIGNCKSAFPDWLSWNYMLNILIMENGLSLDGCKAAADKFYSSIDFYPFRFYINWPGVPQYLGNILASDERFVRWLYEVNGDEFIDITKVKDIKGEKKEAVYGFLESAVHAVALVDCENTDPYRLFAAFTGLSEYKDKISRLILIDDPHTVNVWKSLENLLPFPVEHVLVERVAKNKSLVDHKLIIRACMEFYQNNVDSFMLISSDSDFSELIRSLPARFIVFLDKEYVGGAFLAFLKDNRVPFCEIDEFLSKSGDELRNQHIRSKVAAKLEALFENGINDIFEEVLKEEYLTLPAVEKEELRRSIAMNLKISFTDGRAIVDMKN